MAATFSTEAEEDSGKKKTKSRDVAEDTGSEYAQACIAAAAALQAPETASRDMEARGQGSDDLSALSPPTAAGPNWRFLGPSGRNNGQTYGDTRINVSGRISCIAIDPSNSNHILCGSGVDDENSD